MKKRLTKLKMGALLDAAIRGINEWEFELEEIEDADGRDYELQAKISNAVSAYHILRNRAVTPQGDNQ